MRLKFSNEPGRWDRRPALIRPSHKMSTKYPLIAALRDRNDSVRRCAALALAQLGRLLCA